MHILDLEDIPILCVDYVFIFLFLSNSSVVWCGLSVVNMQHVAQRIILLILALLQITKNTGSGLFSAFHRFAVLSNDVE